VEQREREVERLKEENGTPDEDVAALRQKVQSLRDELETARAEHETTDERETMDEQADARPGSEESSADPPEGAVPKVLVKEIEQWIAEHSDQHRAVTLRVHPFVAAFLRRPVPTHPTRWFMEHLVRVHLEADAEVPPHTFQVAQSPSGELLPESP
ncbi:MAG: ribonuclease E/G, partial [Bacteroidetes bacterium QS_1_63_11]